MRSRVGADEVRDKDMSPCHNRLVRDGSQDSKTTKVIDARQDIG